ncbi:HesA/MoeB/ThiF family protein [Candidatus Bathyarchaeota archaeon]|nr:HesA/MoeB/ThiF family protein [Candidatus Bathyarchaeota archaeon]
MNDIKERRLTLQERKRYNRQMLIQGWGETGQLKLRNARVTVAGSGGLGNPASLYLAAAGVGRITLIDNDCYELSNLNRQILSCEQDIGRPKVDAAKEKLCALNSTIQVNTQNKTIKADNVDALIKDSDVVIDAMDNWATRYILNKACIDNRIPLVHAGIQGLSGQITTIIPGKGPCLQCLIPKPPPEVRPFPVLGATAGLFATLQVMEAIKLILGTGETLVGRLFLLSGEDMTCNIVRITRSLDCPACGKLK